MPARGNQDELIQYSTEANLLQTCLLGSVYPFEMGRDNQKRECDPLSS